MHLNFRYSTQIPGAQPCFGNFSPRNFRGTPCEDDDEDTITTQELDVQKSLEFWSLLGRVFVYNGYVLRDPWHVMTLMKPLVHHHVISMKFCEEYCVGSFDAMKECLLQLHQRSLLDHRLLSHFKHWAELSLEAQQSMLMFFQGVLHYQRPSSWVHFSW